MPILEEILDSPATPTPSDPRLKRWSERIERTRQYPALEVYHRATAFGPGLPELRLHFSDHGDSCEPKVLVWDLYFARFSINWHRKTQAKQGGWPIMVFSVVPKAPPNASSIEKPKENRDSRPTNFAQSAVWDDELNSGLIQLRVRAADPANEVERFAPGLRAALRKAEREFGYDLITERDLTRYPGINEVIQYVSASRPDRTGSSYPICRDMIAFALAGRRLELESQLGYSPEEAQELLVRALARYLDERYSVSSRRRLGLL